MFTIQKPSPVTCLTHLLQGDEILLVLGDEVGYLRVLRLKELLDRMSVTLIKDSNIHNRNPYRIEDKVY